MGTVFYLPPPHAYMYSPPLTSIDVPVMKLAPSDARKTTTPATSSGVPRRLSGVAAIISANLSGGNAAGMAVSMTPGLMQLTRMPYGAACLASDFVRQMTPALAAA